MDNTLTLTPETVEMDAREEIAYRFSNPDVMTRLIRQAVREAVLDHKRAGNPIATMKGGKVVIIQPEDIEVPEE